MLALYCHTIRWGLMIICQEVKGHNEMVTYGSTFRYQSSLEMFVGLNLKFYAGIEESLARVSVEREHSKRRKSENNKRHQSLNKSVFKFDMFCVFLSFMTFMLYINIFFSLSFSLFSYKHVFCCVCSQYDDDLVLRKKYEKCVCCFFK
jgi:hypothetical protein